MIWLAAALASAFASPGPVVAELDLLRPGKGGPRIYVQVGLPDGSTGLFLVDTGADISVLSESAAARVTLVGDHTSRVAGVAGSATVRMATLPYVELDDGVRVGNVLVAVGVPGFSDRVAFLPVDGILGNNVWSAFTLELDYPHDRMTLREPRRALPERRSTPMFFDGSHLYARVDVTTDEAVPRTSPVIAQIDTGASELTVCAGTGLGLGGTSTEGLEALLGIGASETLPPFRFLAMTRRIPVSSVRLGGRDVPVTIPARWRDYENPGRLECRSGAELRALLGHEYLQHSRVAFDFQHGRWSLRRAPGRPRLLDGHEVLYAQDVALHGPRVPERGLDRGRLLAGAGREEEAVEELRAYVDGGGVDPEARVLLAALLRGTGRHVEAWEVLAPLSAGELVDEEQIVGTVNGLGFDDRGAEALEVARRAVAERPDEGGAWVALADVLLGRRQLEEARDALIRAAELAGYPDAHLLRRARVALASGDRLGSMTLVRRLLQLYPGDGPSLWFYAMLLESEADRERFRTDVALAMDRLHPYARPHDFLVAAYGVLGDRAEVVAHLRAGLERDCDPLLDGPSVDNCRAWYLALAGERPDEALALIDRALAATGERPDYLDTKAMVHLSRREPALALDAARRAARLSPDDVYMLWQAERVAELATQAGGAR